MSSPPSSLLRWAAVATVATPAAAAAGSWLGWWGPGVTLASAAGSVVGLAALLAAGSALPACQLYGRMLTRCASPHVALTFDDGPHERGTERLLELLDAGGHRATFFLLADRVQRLPGLAQRIVEAGHEVGVHGLTHSSRLTWMSPASGARWLEQARRIIEDTTGRSVRFFRPPFGVTSPRLFAAAAAAELEVAWCSVRTGDGGGIAADAIVRSAATAGPGDVVLLHEGPEATLAAMPALLEALGNNGLRSVTLSELVAS